MAFLRMPKIDAVGCYAGNRDNLMLLEKTIAA
jgi:hypothetical protein